MAKQRILRSAFPSGRQGDVEHFLAYVRKTESCWIWEGSIGTRGYGQITWKIDGRRPKAHRVSYQLFVGPIQAGFVLDHLCWNTSCVNPVHLEPVTPHENIVVRGRTSMSAIHARKTHCVHGHAFSGDNLRFRRGTKHRICQTCRRADAVKRRRMMSAAADNLQPHL